MAPPSLAARSRAFCRSLLSGEATASGHDDVGLGRVGSGLLTLDVAGDLGGALGGNPGDILGSAGTGGLGSIAHAGGDDVDLLVASGLLHALGDAAEVRAAAALGGQLDGCASSGGAQLGSQAAGDDLAAAGSLDQDHVGGVSDVDQRVSGIVDQRASRHGNVQDLVGSTLDGAAEANQGHLVGAQLTSTASQLTGDVCVLSDNQCLHIRHLTFPITERP